jgi:zinc protease
MIRRNLLAAAAIGALSLTGTAAVHAKQVRTPAARASASSGWIVGAGLQSDPDLRLGVLPNGLRFAIRRNATPPGVASLRLRIDTGSLNEKEDQRGLAHFLEHMVFNGSKDVPEGDFVRRLERVGLKFGPDTNAETGFDQTVYKLDLPKTDANTVDTALFLLRQVGDKATLTAGSIDRERGIILAEERTRNSPQLRQAIDELGFTYPGQPLATRIPIGSTDVIKTAPRERLVRFYEAFYRPEKATLIAVGDFDVDAMEAKIRQQFGDWKGEGPAGSNASRGVVARRALVAGEFVDPAVASRATLSWVRPADLDPDSRAERRRDLLDAMVLTILNRRLERLASGQSPAPFIGAQGGESQLADVAETTQLLAVTPPGKWQDGLKAIDAEQRRLVRFGVSQAELTREIANSRAALQAQVAGALTRSSPALAEGLVAAVNDKRTPTSPQAQLAMFEEAVHGLTPATLGPVAARLFTGSGPAVYVTSPVPIAGGKSTILAAYEGATRIAVAAPTAAAERAWPYTQFGTPGQVKERRELGGVGATAVRFANGVRLIVKPTTFAKDQILVQARVGSGRLAESQARPPVDWIVGTAITQGGLRKISAEDLNAALTGKAYSSGIGIDDDAVILNGVTRPADFATQLQVLTAYLSEPGWQTTGLNRMRELSGTIQDQLASTPSGVYGRDAEGLLHSGDGRFRVPTRAEMAATSMDDVKNAVAGQLADGPVEVTVVGDVTVDEAIRQVAATFGALPARSEAALPSPGAMRFPAGSSQPVVLRHKGRADQGLAFIGWPTHGAYSDLKDTRVLNVLSQVFQLRLTDRIREAEGMSYSPGAAHSASDIWDDYGYLFGRVEAPPASLPRFLSEAQSIADDLAAKPVEADELNRALKPLTERMSRDRNGNPWWLQGLGGASTNPRVLDSITTQLADYQAVTPAMLQAAAKRVLVANRAYKLMVVPESAATK